MEHTQAADLIRDAITATGASLTRLPGRAAASGLHEVKELGPGRAHRWCAVDYLGPPSRSTIRRTS